jgi:general nucleoside transport system permease protein
MSETPLSGRRAVAEPLLKLLLSAAAAFAAVLISVAIIALLGVSPVSALSVLWSGAFGGIIQFGDTMGFAVPLMLVALGWIVAFATRRINVGLEGQILVGGSAAAAVGIAAPGLPVFIHLPLAVLSGLVGGGLWAGIAAVLWARYQVNEIISTLMLYFVATQLVSWLVQGGPLQEPTHTYPQSQPVAASARWPHLVAQSPLAGDVFLALLLVCATSFVLDRTAVGLRLRLTGANEVAARSAGISTKRVTALALAASGAFAGLAGSSLILAAQSPVLTPGFSANLGFDGIVVALLARNSPWGVIPSAILLGALLEGGGFLQAQLNVSAAVVNVTQGLVVLLVLGSGLVIGRIGRSRAPTKQPGPGVEM